MLDAVERRFAATYTPPFDPMAPDNGSAYRAHETIDFAIRLGGSYWRFTPRFAVRNPTAWPRCS